MDTCTDRKNYELFQIENDSLYMALFEKIIRIEPVEEHHREGKKIPGNYLMSRKNYKTINQY